MKKIHLICGLCLILLLAAAPALAAFTEPSMGDYAAFPIFSDQSVKPSIMIVLDNSGSMNEPAYTDSFSGAPYIDGYPIVANDDDMEGSGDPSSTPDNQLWDLDLGEHVVGLRFQHVDIPQGTVINSAYIEFVARDSDSVATSLVIEGEASDDAPPFTSANPITNRTPTSATVAWDNVEGWSLDNNYQTPDLAAVVQEIVNRDGWGRGNAMVFRISGTGERDAYPRNDSSTLQPVLRIDAETVQGKRYYGYFNPDYFYERDNGVFVPTHLKVKFNETSSSWTVRAFDAGSETLSATTSSLTDSQIDGGYWDGNWLNWLLMRRVDVLRKVLMGGLSYTRGNGGQQSLEGDNPPNGAHYDDYYKAMDTTGNMPVCPYHGDYEYRINNDGTFSVIQNGNWLLTANIEVQKEPVIEPQDFDESGELVGVLQRIGNKARWGNTWLNSGWDGESGGTVQTPIDGADMDSLVGVLQGKDCNTNTPLAETLYVVMQYFKQESVAGGLGFPSDVLPSPVSRGGENDPYYNQTLNVMVPCAKSFVIMLTDGMPTRDGRVPNYLKDTDGDNDYVSGNDDSTDFLDDVAFYAHTHDLRDDLEDTQSLTLYTIFAFADDDNARTLLRDAAKNGGFEDRDGDNYPNLQEEWDKDEDGVPDTYFEASDGYALENRLLSAITDILKRAASGTAASVLATSNQGSGNSIQAYFRPLVTEGLEDAKWLGYLQSLWVDPWGNFREDSNGNQQLDLFNPSATNTAGADVDKIIAYFSDNDTTKIRRYTAHWLYNPEHGTDDACDPSDPSLDCTIDSEELPMDGITPIFEAGARLADKAPEDRTIFTYLDGDQNSQVDSGEVIDFKQINETALAPYLGVRDGGVWGPDGADLGDSLSNRVRNIITWIRGEDVPGLRNRTLAGNTWRLGDIVHSTPMTVGPPKEYYHLIYSDPDYLDYIQYANQRETVVYVGANDGMMHAFTNWVATEDDYGNIWYEKPSTAPADEEIGDEIWAYIPMSVLPHLKWTAHKDYSHTYYVDAPPRVFDAKILPDDTYYTDSDTNSNYGTFMVFGLNMGGKQISVFEDFGGVAEEERTFHPTFVMMDITEPRNPKLMWERSFAELAMTTSTPQPAHVGKRDGSGGWYLVFGSGPTSYDGDSNQAGHVYVVDMITGQPYGVGGNDWIATSAHNSYFNDALALDLFQSHNTDAIFIANNYIDGGKWQSDLWKIAVPCSQCQWDENPDGSKKYSVKDDELLYSDDPATWHVYDDFFHADGPITAQPTTTVDEKDNLLVYFGTGRYISEDDKEDIEQQYLYCVKDPFYNETKYDGSYAHDFASNLPLDTAGLFNATDVLALMPNAVRPENSVLVNGDNPSFTEFRIRMRDQEDGWYQELLTPTNEPSERIISKVAILGGIAVTPTFSPSADICGMGGDTTLMGVHYETGTGGTRQFFEIDLSNLRFADVGGEPSEIVEIRDDNFFKGMPSPKPVFHAGLEGGARLSTQVGTGEVLNEKTEPEGYFNSIITEWWDDPGQAPPFNPTCNW